MEFFNQNQVSDSEKTDSLDSDLFLVEDSNEVSFTVKSTSDPSKIGRYEIGYKVWYTSEPATVAYSTSPFTVDIYEESNEME